MIQISLRWSKQVLFEFPILDSSISSTDELKFLRSAYGYPLDPKLEIEKCPLDRSMWGFQFAILQSETCSHKESKIISSHSLIISTNHRWELSSPREDFFQEAACEALSIFIVAFPSKTSIKTFSLQNLSQYLSPRDSLDSRLKSMGFHWRKWSWSLGREKKTWFSILESP